jgi:Ca-activated chloride channel family protein
MAGTLYTIAKDVKLQVEFNPAFIHSYRLIGYENRLLEDEDFNNDKKDAGDMGLGHQVTAFYEIVPVGAGPASPDVDPLKYQQSILTKQAKSSNEIMNIKVRYQTPNGSVSKLIQKTVTTEDEKKPLPSDWLFGATVAAFGIKLQHADVAEPIKIEKLLPQAKRSKGIDENGYRAEFIRLLELAQLMGE